MDPAANPTSSTPSTFVEKREFARLPFRGRAKALIFPVSGQERKTLADSEVMTSDLSREGVSILCRQELAQGQQLLLALDGTNRLVEVRWCCRVWNGLFAAGCRFVGTPGEPSAEQLLNAVDEVINDECLWWDGSEPPEAAP
jgi:hypothetical protein